MKIRKAPCRNNRYKARHWLFFAFLILNITLVSSLDFDNVKDYDPQKREVTITNAFGFGDELLKARLTSPLNVNVIDKGKGIYQKVGEIEVSNLDKGYSFKNTLGKIDTYNIKAGMRKLSRDVKYKLRTVGSSYQSPITETYCPTEDLDDCYTEILDYETIEIFEWKEINSLDDFPEGKFTVGLFTDVQEGDRVDWIPEFFGVRVDEWAVWTESLNNDLKAYWTLNESSGDVVENVVGGGRYFNGTVGSADVGLDGLIGTAYGFDAVTDYMEFNTTMLNGTTKNLTLAFWFYKAANWENGDYLWEYHEIVGDPFLVVSYITFSDSLFIKGNIGGSTQFEIFGDMPQDRIEEWTMVVLQFTLDGSGNASLWINNTLMGSDNSVSGLTVTEATNHTFGDSKVVGGNSFNGTIDEIGWWDRYLSPDEIEDLYNDGNGITFNTGNPDAEITFPREVVDYQILNTNISLNWSVSGNVESCWYSLDDGAINISVVCSDLTTQYNITQISNNSVTFYINDSSNNQNSSFASWNYAVFQWADVFNNQTIEGSSEYFEINITTNGSRLLTADLIYGDDVFSGVFTNPAEDNYTISRNLDIPTVTSLINNTFFWNLTLEGGAVIETLGNNQTVQDISIDDCSVNTELILNFTLKDEETQLDLSEALDLNLSIEIDINVFPIGSSISIINFSGNFSEENNPQICLSIDLDTTEYRLTSIIFYDADEYSPEFYNIQNATLSNDTIPNNVDLLDLRDDDATRFVITFKDANFIPTEDALIIMQRNYISDGIFKVVEIPKTDNNGRTAGYFDTAKGNYNILVMKNGVILASFNNTVVFCEDELIGDCQINLNALSTGIPFTDWEELGGIIFTTSFDPEARTITTIFSSVDGTSKTVLSNATKYDRLGNETVCFDSLTTSSGTLICSIPDSFGNTTILSVLSVNDESISQRIYSILPSSTDRFGGQGGILFLLLMLTLPLMLITSTIGIIIGVIAGVVLGSLLMLYTSNSIIGPTSIVIWAIISGGIIIWKIARRE